MTISYEKAFPSGAWILSAMVHGHLFHRQYMGYTRAEAAAEFRLDVVESMREIITNQSRRTK